MLVCPFFWITRPSLAGVILKVISGQHSTPLHIVAFGGFSSPVVSWQMTTIPSSRVTGNDVFQASGAPRVTFVDRDRLLLGKSLNRSHALALLKRSRGKDDPTLTVDSKEVSLLLDKLLAERQLIMQRCRQFYIAGITQKCSEEKLTVHDPLVHGRVVVKSFTDVCKAWADPVYEANGIPSEDTVKIMVSACITQFESVGEVWMKGRTRAIMAYHEKAYITPGKGKINMNDHCTGGYFQKLDSAARVDILKRVNKMATFTHGYRIGRSHGNNNGTRGARRAIGIDPQGVTDLDQFVYARKDGSPRWGSALEAARRQQHGSVPPPVARAGVVSL